MIVIEYWATVVSIASNGSLSSAASFGRIYDRMKVHLATLPVSETSAWVRIMGSNDNSTFDLVYGYDPAAGTANPLQIKSTIGGIWFGIDMAAGFKYLKVQVPSFNISGVMSCVFYGSNPFSG